MTAPVPAVALVLVSHSRALAEGLAELAAQMAPDVALLPAGGTADGALGTGYERVAEAIEAAVAGGRSAVVLCDLGSAVLTAESALEATEPDVVERVRIAVAPFVEGAVEAAVVAQGGADLDAVLRAAQGAGAGFGSVSTRDAGRADGTTRSPRDAPDPGATPGTVAPANRTEPSPSAAFRGPGRPGDPTDEVTARGTAVLRNRLGLHARPAAALARTASGFASTITVNGADCRSVLGLLGLGATGGDELLVVARGPDARTAVSVLVAEIDGGFGEA